MERALSNANFKFADRGIRKSVRCPDGNLEQGRAKSSVRELLLPQRWSSDSCHPTPSMCDARLAAARDERVGFVDAALADGIGALRGQWPCERD